MCIADNLKAISGFYLTKMLRCFRYIFILHVLTVILYGSSTSSLHELSFHISNVFGSHMVLQANEVVSFWGWDEKGARVEVRFNNKKYTTTANVESGLWRIEFPAMKPSFVPYDITVIGSSNQMQVLEDILFGDVILCSGSSNMEFTLDDAVTGDEEAQLANKYPYIRLTSGPLQGSYDLKSIDSTPYNELGVINLPWSVASNETVVKPDQTSEWDYYSAVCWFTLRHLFDELDGKIPLGGVVQAFGGSSIQFWSSPEAIQVCGDVYQPGSSCCGYGGADSCLYHSQLAPYAVGPTKFKQIIWYQGEQNAGFGGPSQTEYYNCALPALIIDLRSKFQQPNLGFGICLLTPWQSESSPTLEFADLRQVQLKTALTIENTFIINTLDQGDPETGDIHSPFKLRVGIRAAQGTLSVAYGRKDIQYRGPQIRASDIIIEPPVAITRTQQHITNKIVPTLSRALLSFSVQQQSQKTNPIKNDNRDSENSIDGRSVIDSEAKLYLNSSVVCPPSLNIRG